MKTYRFRAAVASGASLAALIFAMPASAQDAPAPADAATDNSEIVVTAQKRVERLQDVPQSITVANEAALQRQQVNTVADLSRIAPSLEIQQAPGQSVGGGGQIRGIGTQSFQQGAVGSVGITVDQVSQGNVNISDLFDIARVEVLKGPQGTLFGLTTSAGVINITTNQPEFDRFSARIRTELSAEGVLGSGFGRQVVQGLVNVPVSANAALRLSGNVNLTQGVDRNLLNGELDQHNTYGFRGRFRWEPTENLRINLIGDYTHSHEEGQDFFVIYKAAIVPTPPPPGQPPSPPLATELAGCGVVAGEGNRDYCSTDRVEGTTDTFGVSGQVDYDAGIFTLTSITAYRRQDTGPTYGSIFRLDVHNPRILLGPGSGNSSLFTQEFRIASPTGARLEYTAGLFYSAQRQYGAPSPFNIRIVLPFPPFVIPAVSLNGTETNLSDDSFAVFGQATFHVDDHLRLIAGARYTGERLGVRYRSADTGNTGQAHANIDNFSWRLGAQYEFNRDLMVYGTVSRGYKGPQIALGDPSSPTNVPTIIRPEIPTNYEIGLKGSFANGRLVVDLNAFLMNLKDYQGQICNPNANGGLSCVPQNISRVQSKGIELNVTGRPVDGLVVNAGVIYNSVRYPAGFQGSNGLDPNAVAQPIPTIPVNLGGLQLAAAPEWKATFSGEYSHEVTSGAEAFLGVDLVYKSSLRLGASTRPEMIYGPHATLGGRLGVRSPDGRWSAAIFARNLTNNHEPVIRFLDFPDGSRGSVGQILTPQAFRQVGISLDARF